MTDSPQAQPPRRATSRPARAQGTRRLLGFGALTGLLTAAVAVGVSQLLAAFTGPGTAPVTAVGSSAIDLAPAPVKNFAISAFGSNDKTVLLMGILMVLALFAAAIGVAAVVRLGYGFAGLGLFAAIGMAAALTRPNAGALSVVPTLAGAAAGAFVLARLAAAATSRAGAAGPPARAPGGPDRRRFLITGAVALGTAGLGVAGGRLLSQSSARVAKARSTLSLPAPAHPAAPLPPGSDLRIPGLAPFVTPNSTFYRVDTALVLPQVPPGNWRLRIHGMVGRELTLTYHDLINLPLAEHYTTLTCVSNPVGGIYIGNARWLGASLASLLRKAGIRRGADQLLCTSTDGFTCGAPVQAVMDGRESLLAVAMNGSPLPVAHGFPVRMVVPGLYGYVSATKWVTDIKVTTFASEQAYWIPRGWAQQAPIKTQARIDVPHGGGSLRRGRNTVAGVAWAQHRGVDAVEVRVDNGPWHPARLAAVPGIDTWRQWTWDWDAGPGHHRIQARATDATGHTQVAAVAPPEPDGATGYPTVAVSVS